MPVVEYHHIRPFAECKAHEPEQIALLCPTHHGRVTSGAISDESVLRMRQAPFALAAGKCVGADIFYLEHPLKLRIGSNVFDRFECIVRNSLGDEWFSIRRADDGSDMVHLNATFYNPDGSRSLRITRNIWDCDTSGLWDIRAEGNVLSVWRAQRKEHLRLRAEPPHTLVLERLDMRLGDRGLTVWPDGTAELDVPGGSFAMSGVGTQVGTCIYYIT